MKTKRTITIVYACTYTLPAEGFQFSTLAEYDAGSARLQARQREEWGLEVIDGPDGAARLARAAGLHQGIVEPYLRAIEALVEDIDMAAAIYALEHDFSLEQIADREWLDSFIVAVGLREGTPEDVAREWAEEGLFTPATMELYFDWDAFGVAIEDDLCEAAVEAARENAKADGRDADEAEAAERERREHLSPRDVAEEWLENVGGIRELTAETREEFLDVESLVRDMEINGEIDSMTFGGREFVITNPQGVVDAV